MDLTSQILELIRISSTDLPADVERAIQEATKKEEKESSAETVLLTIEENIKLARKESTAMCQDTGSLVFYIDYPEGGIERVYSESILDAVREATKLNYLRPNTVSPLSGKNSGDNIGKNAPYLHFHQWEKDYVRIRFMQKGGGCENCGAQYRLPDTTLNAGRDIKGVRKAIIDAVFQAQGQGCAPAILGISIGGDRAVSYTYAKEQLFRKIGERNPDKEIAEFEVELCKELNSLGIGPMGFGGKTTILDVLVGIQPRHPASFFVSISYMCWACRRRTLTIKGSEVEYD